MTKTNIEAGQTLKLDGINYVVERCVTPEDHDAASRPNLAAHMREYKQIAQLYLRRPNESKIYLGFQSIGGGISPLVGITLVDLLS